MAESDYYEPPKPAVDKTGPGWYMSQAGVGDPSVLTYDPTMAMAAQQKADADYLAKYRDTTITAKNGPMAGQEIRPIFTEGARYGGPESDNYSLDPKKISGYGFMPNGEHNYFYDTAGNYLFDDGATVAKFNRGMATGLGAFLGAGALSAAGAFGGAASTAGALTPAQIAMSDLAVYPTSGIVGAIPATAATGLGGLTAAEIYALTPSQLAAYAPAVEAGGAAAAATTTGSTALTPAQIAASDLSVYPTSGIVGSVPATATTGLGGLTAAEINALTPAQLAQYAPGAAAASSSPLQALKDLGGKAAEWYKNASPFELASLGLGAASLIGGSGGSGSSAPPPKGFTQDSNFSKPLDLYKYTRDKVNYKGALNKYGQVGQPNAAEHQFFKNTKFVPLPIPANMGGLIQMKHFAQGGQAQGMQDPRRAQMMQAMAQQRQAGQGGSMGMAQARPPMMQGAPQRMPQGMPPQDMSQQGMLQAHPQMPQMPQRPRDPKMAYYQYGNPPAKAMAMGGLNQVHSLRIGGGADGRSDDVNAVLSDGEYVMDAETVAMLGNGSSKAGASKLDQMRSKLRQHKGKNLASGKISPNAKSPLAYLKGA